MTFIASVIAKDGVAVIADSLITASEQVISRNAFLKYLENIKEKVPSSPRAMISDLTGLFKSRKSYTKDYEEKLIKYDDYTCVAFTGLAAINQVKISKLIYDLIENNNNRTNKRKYYNKGILTKVKHFKNYIQQETKKHIRKYGSISDITFIITHFDKKNKKTRIFKVDVKSADKDTLKEGTEFVVYREAYDWEKVVTDGQNKICERILLGHLTSIPIVSNIISPIIVNNISQELNIDQTKITPELIKKVSLVGKLPSEIFDDVKILGLELSLQQATDLAALLMRVEMDFQKYTEDIPTVGGVIKLATINEKGVEFHSGNTIIKPRNI